MIDTSTIHTLELIQNLQNAKSRDCLYGLMNETLTPMGARLLRTNILQPSTQKEDVLIRRYDAVEELSTKEEMFFATRSGKFTAHTAFFLYTNIISRFGTLLWATAQDSVITCIYKSHVFHVIHDASDYVDDGGDSSRESSPCMIMLGPTGFSEIRIVTIIDTGPSYQKVSCQMLQLESCFTKTVQNT